MDHRGQRTGLLWARMGFLWMILCGMTFSASADHVGQTGKVAGQIVDAATGQTLPSVTVVIVETGQGAISDVDGNYVILNIKPGTYKVRFSFVGFATQTVEGVRVIVDKTTRVNVRMTEETIQGEEVVITADRPMVELDRTTTTAVIEAEQLDVLPVRGVNDVVGLQAGVVDGHFRGGRFGEVAYLVNGVPINNSFNNNAAFEIEQNMIASLEVISGIFNAEYGQALSGVVNIVTKDIPRQWSGNVLSYAGAIVSPRKLEFVNRTTDPSSFLGADDFASEFVPYYEASPTLNLMDVQGSVGGPLLQDKLGVQVSARYLRDNGYLLGRRLFAPSDSSQNLNSGLGQNTWVIESTGDGAFVPLGTTERYTINTSLVYNLSTRVKLDYNLFFQSAEGRGYSHGAKYVPDGINRWFANTQTHILGLRWTLSNTSFANISYSLLRDNDESRLYDTPFDARYQSSQLGSLSGVNAFQVGGNDLFTSDNLTTTHTIVADYTNQLTNVHQLKAGFSARLHKLNNRSFGIEKSFRTGFQPQPSPDVFSDNTLNASPLEWAIYVQDKMEFNNLIVNAGLRFDYFDPDYLIPVDWAQPQNERIFNPASPADSLSNRTPAEVEVQLSPRLGIAFPISADGVLRFSAGMFFQIPQFSLLFTNPEYEVNPQSSSNQFGNAGINPERTLSFEVGLQQGLTESLGLELTVFSRDIRNLTGQEILRDPNGNLVVRWINRDFGTVRGFTFSMFQRPVGILSWTLDYTLSFAGGSASDPGEAFGRFQSGLEENFRIQRLNWDRRHTLNNTITLTPRPGLSFTLVNKLLSGTPYTTVRDFVRSFERNNADKPTYFLTDLRLFYQPGFLQQDLQVFLQVENLLDIRPQWAVYEDTGLATESFEKELFRQTGTPVGGVNSLDEFYFQQGFFGSPRKVSLGLKVNF